MENPTEKPIEKNGNGKTEKMYEVLVEYYKDNPIKLALVNVAYRDKNVFTRQIRMRENVREMAMDQDLEKRGITNNKLEEEIDIPWEELVTAEEEEEAIKEEDRKKTREGGHATMPKELSLVAVNPEAREEKEPEPETSEDFFEKSYHLLSRYYHDTVQKTGNHTKMTLINEAFKNQNRQTVFAYLKELNAEMAIRRKVERIKKERAEEELLKPIETTIASKEEALSEGPAKINSLEDLFEPIQEPIKADSNLEDLFEPIEAGTPEKIMAERNAEAAIKMGEKLKEAWAKKEEFLPEIEKQQGLAYKLGIRHGNAEIQKEYTAACNSYDEALDYLEFLTDKSREDIEAEYLGIRRAEEEPKMELIKEFLTEKMEEVNEQVERLRAEERAAYESIKKLAAEKGLQVAVGLAISGVVLAAPPTGFVEMITMGVSTGILPAALGAKAAIAAGIGGGYLIGRGGLTNFVNSLKSRGVSNLDFSKKTIS